MSEKPVKTPFVAWFSLDVQEVVRRLDRVKLQTTLSRIELMIHILSKSFTFNSIITQILARNLHSDEHKKWMLMK